MFRLAQSRSDMEKVGFYLFKQSWNDYWDYQTSFVLMYMDEAGASHSIGDLKIGQKSKAYTSEDPRTEIPSCFDRLSNDFFSLGQEDSYYEKLNKLGSNVRKQVLAALRDMAYSEKTFRMAKELDCTKISLLRFVTPETVQGQFRRLAQGGVRLTDYSFSYAFPVELPTEPRDIHFDVRANSNPPTNVQVLIGRNGVGKSTLLDAMARAFVLAGENGVEDKYGHFEFPEGKDSRFANLVSVSFSAFDSFTPLTVHRDRTRGPLYEYIGLKKISMDQSKLRQASKQDVAVTTVGIKDLSMLSKEYLASVKVCLNPIYLERWYRMISILESDPLFSTTGIPEIVARARALEPEERMSLIAEFKATFSRLSSGHKIVLLTITRLVQTVTEKTLVLLDEPEAHLHPPLLSAFTRALSDLLADRNGVAIVATHSPVILQEVPKSCVWILSRSGYHSRIRKPRTETFGENMGTLTSEIFSLEVTATGFHKRLFDAANESDSYEEALEKFDNQLGSEGRILLESMIIGDSEMI